MPVSRTQLRRQLERAAREFAEAVAEPASPNPRRQRHRRIYNSRMWRRMSIEWRELYPICFECSLLGKNTPVHQVDHIIPHAGDDELAFDWDNLQSLCSFHHTAKTAQETEQGIEGPWMYNPARLVMSGLPGVGKTWSAMHHYAGHHVWDFDLEAKRLGFPKYPRPEAIVRELLRRRDDWLTEHAGQPVVFIMCHVGRAARFARERHMGFLHLHCPEIERLNRLQSRGFEQDGPNVRIAD